VVLLDTSKLPALVFRITNVRANAVAQVSEPVLPGKSPGRRMPWTRAGAS
jgi:hypothetical protein